MPPSPVALIPENTAAEPSGRALARLSQSRVHDAVFVTGDLATGIPLILYIEGALLRSLAVR